MSLMRKAPKWDGFGHYCCLTRKYLCCYPSRLLCFHTWWVYEWVVFIKSQEDTSEYPEWSHPQPRGLNQWFSSWCSWWRKLLPVWGIILICVFSCTCLYCCCDICLRYSQRAIRRAPSKLWHLLLTTQGILRKRRACEIVRAGHKGCSVGGGHQEDGPPTDPWVGLFCPWNVHITYCSHGESCSFTLKCHAIPWKYFTFKIL